MKALTIRGLSDKTYDALVKLASKSGRSLQQQARLILEREGNIQRIGMLRRAKTWRDRLKGRKWNNISSEIRKERESR